MPYYETTATHKIARLRSKVRAVQGGCLAKGTKVLMYDLTSKKVEDIVVGDKLMGNDGTHRSVLNLCRGTAQMYEVTQSKGITYTVNNEHILVTEDQGKDIRGYENGKRVYLGRKHEGGYHKHTAENFCNQSWKKSTRQYKGIKAKLDFKEEEIDLDPYYLGLWLGDGTQRNAYITNIDQEVKDFLYNELPKLYDVTVKKLDEVTTAIVKNEGKYNDIVQRLKGYNLIRNKHIPLVYIKNSRQVRLKVLAGLIDSDGCLSRDYLTKETKGYYITQKSKILADDIATLSRSLGYNTTVHARIATMKREDATVYECEVYTVGIFCSDYGEVPVKIERKKCDKVVSRSVLRSTLKIEKKGVDNYYGFELDGNHLFLLEDFTITHNTSASKTISILIILISLAQTDTESTLTSVVAESLPHLKKGALRDFKKIMKEHKYWGDAHWNATDSIYTFETGSQIEFFGSDQPEKLRGGRRDRGFMNECNNMALESFDEFEVRTKEFVFLDWNPTIEFWFYNDVLGSRDDVDHIILTYKDNEGCPPEIVKSIEQRKNRLGWWRVYGLGLLGEVEGRIYTGWKFIDEVPHEAKLIRYVVDFGYTNDPATIQAMYSYNGGYIFDQIAYRKGMSNKNIADIILNLEEPALVIGDSSEPKSIDEIKSYGVDIVGAVKRKEKVGPHKSYNSWAIEKVQGEKISLTKRSVETIKEYNNYLWATDRDGKILNEPEGIDDHSMDGIKYGIVSVIQPEKRSAIVSKPIWKGYNKLSEPKKQTKNSAKVYKHGIMQP